MSPILLGVIVLVVVLIVGPFATLRAVERYRIRKDRLKTPAQLDAEDEARGKDRGGFW